MNKSIAYAAEDLWFSDAFAKCKGGPGGTDDCDGAYDGPRACWRHAHVFETAHRLVRMRMMRKAAANG